MARMKKLFPFLLVAVFTTGVAAQEAAPAATLRSGGECFYDKHNQFKCVYFCLACDRTPRVRLIDGKGPGSFGKKGHAFNGEGWTTGFKLALTPGQHTVTMSYYFMGGAMIQGRPYNYSARSQDNLTVTFVAEPGHTYRASEMAFGYLGSQGWRPVIVDVTDKKTVHIVSELLPDPPPTDARPPLQR
jgi:hypothetical protein